MPWKRACRHFVVSGRVRGWLPLVTIRLRTGALPIGSGGCAPISARSVRPPACRGRPRVR